MKLLLDTCSFLWLVTDHEQLSESAKILFLDPSHEIMISTVSAWEISLKWKIGTLELTQSPDAFVTDQIQKNQLSVLPIALQHTLKTAELAFHHKDPFDRLLVAQALVEEIPLISPAPILSQYGVARIW